MTIRVIIDGDACPVKAEAIKVAQRYAIGVILVSNQGMRPIHNVRQVVVGSEFDAADNWIVEHAEVGDIVITADIQLAGRCIAKGCKALNPTGYVYNPSNIGTALSMRALNAHLRETGEIAGYNPSFSKKDRSQFLQALDTLIQKST